LVQQGSRQWWPHLRRWWLRLQLKPSKININIKDRWMQDSTAAPRKLHRISTALACATAGLLGSGCALMSKGAPAADAAAPTWKYDSAALAYAESGGRVKGFKGALSAELGTDTGAKLGYKVSVDTLTGASATGAVSTDRPQTFTTASGNSRYTVNPSATPLDGEFRDTRISGSVDWEAALNTDSQRGLRYGLGVNASREYDYLSFAVSGRLLKDLNEKNTNLSAAISLGSDRLNPVGGVPNALARASDAERVGRESSQSKSVLDVLLGVTQIIDARSFFQANYGLTRTSGYHNDPYKFVSLVDADGRPFDAASDAAASVLYEKHPDSRTRHALFARYRGLGASSHITDVSYRFTSDDWGTKTHAIEGRYRFAVGDSSYLQPRLRLYSQSAADFYTGFLRQGQTLPQYASADYRLADMRSYTVGVEYGFGPQAKPWRVSLDYYSQRPKEPDGKFGVLQSQQLSPAVNAVLLRLNKSF
jgi:Protein of unknown function (DUF3570)